MSKIDVLIQIRDRFSNKFKRLNDGLKRSAARFRVWARRISGAIAVTAAAFAKGLISLNKFEKGVARIEALMGGRKDTGLRDAIRQIQLASGRDAQESVEGFYQAISRGVPRDNVYEFMRTAAKAAVVDGSTIQASVEGITTVLNAFNMDASKTEQVAEAMFAAVAEGATTFELISTNIAQAAPTAAAFGVELEELLGSLQVMTKKGFSTSQSFTQINSAMLAINRVLGEGWRSQYTLIQAMEQMNVVAEQQGKTLLKVVGREEAFRAILALTGDTAGETKRAIDELRKGSNKLDEALQGTTGDAIKLDQTFQAFKLNGVAAITALDKSLGGFKDGLKKILQSAAVDLDNFSRDPSWAKVGEAMRKAFVLSFGTKEQGEAIIDQVTKGAEAAKRFDDIKKRQAEWDKRDKEFAGPTKEDVARQEVELQLRIQRELNEEREKFQRERERIDKEAHDKAMAQMDREAAEIQKKTEERERKIAEIEQFFADKREKERVAQIDALMFADVQKSLPKQVEEFVAGREKLRDAGNATHEMLKREQRIRDKLKARGQGFKLSKKDQKFLDDLEHFRANAADVAKLKANAPEVLMEQHLRKIKDDMGLVLMAAPRA